MADRCCCSNLPTDQLDRIEAKLDALLDALAAEEDGAAPAFDLDGDLIGGERDQDQEL